MLSHSFTLLLLRTRPWEFSPRQVLAHAHSRLFPAGTALVSKAHLRMAQRSDHWDEVVHPVKGLGRCVNGKAYAH